VTTGDVMIAMSRAGDGPRNRLPSAGSGSPRVRHGGRHQRAQSGKGGLAVGAGLATLAAELAAVLDHVSAAGSIAAAVRRVAGGASGFVLAPQTARRWEVEAADPPDAALDAGMVAALVARFDARAGVRRWTRRTAGRKKVLSTAVPVTSVEAVVALMRNAEPSRAARGGAAAASWGEVRTAAAARSASARAS